jgi:replicative DNA helicase
MSTEKINGIPSGIAEAEMDAITSGFQRSDLIIIGSRPSLGKTTFALSISEFLCIKKNIPAAFFSMEMSKANLLTRNHALEHSNTAPFYIVDFPGITIAELCAKSKEIKTKEKIEIIFIDYFELIKHENQTLPQNQQALDISQSLKKLAGELDIPIVVLAQLKRNDDNPTLADLNFSSEIAQSADMIIFLTRDESSDTKLHVVKERNR